MSDQLRRPDGAPPRVIVAGGGVAALETVLALRALAGARVAIEVVSPEPHLHYPPLDVVEPFGLAPPRVELGEALASQDATHRLDAVVDVDPVRHRIRTRDGAILPYEALVVAVGGRRVPPLVGGALVFTGPRGRTHFRELLQAIDAGVVRSILFVVPRSVGWPLPLYELALMTATRPRPESGSVHVTLATAERGALDVFGGRASGQLLERLGELAVTFIPGVHLDHVRAGEARLAPTGQSVRADRIVTLPGIAGPAVPGLPTDHDGFLPVDAHGNVRGAYDVYAAGDAIAFPIKHGGLGTQQADAVAESIAARCGVPLEPAPFRPVLRGMLLTGEQPQFLEAGVGELHAGASGGRSPLWWPPAKVAGRYLAPFLAARLGQPPTENPGSPSGWTEDAIPFELSHAGAMSTTEPGP